MACIQPQAHPERCGCQQELPNSPPSFGGINVIRDDFLPAKTMVVSRDVFEILKAKDLGVKR